MDQLKFVNTRSYTHPSTVRKGKLYFTTPTFLCWHLFPAMVRFCLGFPSCIRGEFVLIFTQFAPPENTGDDDGDTTQQHFRQSCNDFFSLHPHGGGFGFSQLHWHKIYDANRTGFSDPSPGRHHPTLVGGQRNVSFSGSTLELDAILCCCCFRWSHSIKF